MFWNKKPEEIFKAGDNVGISFNINARNGAQFFTGSHFDDTGIILREHFKGKDKQYYIVELDGSYMGDKLVCISNKVMRKLI